jgi:hypothetical protein
VTAAGVDLYWIPLGAGTGGAVVRFSGRSYEALAARRAGRPRCDLYHSALQVHADGETWSIEMAPVWTRPTASAVVGEGPVGSRWLGRWRLFRYEVRCWAGGTIPDLADAVGGPLRTSTERATALAVVELTRSVPAGTWGRDEARLGDMWNSNSMVAWLLARSGHDMDLIAPPPGGRAPGWSAGVAAAQRQLDAW